MADKLPIKYENGSLSQFEVGDTISQDYLPTSGFTSNKLTANLTIPTDKSYIVVSELDLNGFDLTINGNLGILG